MGSLTADLLTMHNDNYVIRAQVQVEGVILATGLAAAPSIEAAEDQARVRALQTLILEQAVSTNPTLPINLSQTMLDQATPTLDQTAPTASQLTEPPQLAKADPDIFPAVNDSVEKLTFLTKSEPQTANLPSDKVEKPKIAQFNTPNIAQSPVDLSDIIAQTDVELRRLGWTSAQGREYLEQTYGKRSRQQLSDEELLAFLLYLESQTSPIESQI